MKAAVVFAMALAWSIPTASLAGGDLTAGVSRTYIIDTVVIRPDREAETASTLELELTPFRTADGGPAIRYRPVPGSRRYRSDLLTMLVRAFDRTPIEIRLSASGNPIGLVDWPNQRDRLVQAIRVAGRELGIDPANAARAVERSDEATAMVLLVDEVRLLSLVQSVTIGRPEAQTCTLIVTHRSERPASLQTLGARDQTKAEASLSRKDGWAVDAQFDVHSQYDDGEEETVRHSFRRLNPPDPSSCPTGHS